MYRKLFFLMSFVLVLGLVLTNTAEAASLVGCGMLDEDSATTATDSSGNGNHGTLIGGFTWQPTGG